MEQINVNRREDGILMAHPHSLLDDNEAGVVLGLENPPHTRRGNIRVKVAPVTETTHNPPAELILRVCAPRSRRRRKANFVRVFWRGYPMKEMIYVFLLAVLLAPFMTVAEVPSQLVQARNGGGND